jgi:hypothetical protein
MDAMFLQHIGVKALGYFRVRAQATFEQIAPGMGNQRILRITIHSPCLGGKLNWKF